MKYKKSDPDLNRHEVASRILSPLCLPIPPPGHGILIIIFSFKIISSNNWYLIYRMIVYKLYITSIKPFFLLKRYIGTFLQNVSIFLKNSLDDLAHVLCGNDVKVLT